MRRLSHQNASVKTAPAEKPGSCLARQPILNKDEKVLGYELLFRESPEENRFNFDFEGGTRSIIDTLNVMGLDVVCDGRVAFINCTHEMLLKEFFLLLPAEKNCDRDPGDRSGRRHGSRCLRSAQARGLPDCPRQLCARGSAGGSASVRRLFEG